ncbi:MAG: SH3 domain-containing protein [Caldilineaceae bacterium]|nr:SH3 domain-containing protein [Caldilineaceae bacterium]
MNAHQHITLLMLLALIGLVHCTPPVQQFSQSSTAVLNHDPIHTAAAALLTVDATATYAIQLLETALIATPHPLATPALTATAIPTLSPTATPAPPTLTFTPSETTALAVTQAASRDLVGTAVAGTLTALAPPPPDLAATETAVTVAQIATSVAATLNASVTRPPTVPTTGSNPSVTVVDADGKLNLRAGPATSDRIIQQLDDGETVTILGRLATNTWVQIQTTEGVIGWGAATYLKSPIPIENYPIVTPLAPPPTPTARTSCAYAVASVFAARWGQSEMGCALGSSQITWASFNVFERGSIIWRRDTNTLYVFYNNGQWQALPDQWDGVAEPSSRGSPPPGLQAPIRGAGWVWGNNEMVFQGLGWAVDKQKGFCAEVQTFEHGFLLQSSAVEFCHEEKLYNFAREGGFGVLFLKAHHSGYWQR